MILLYLLGLILTLAIFYMIATQISIPIINGTKIFPGLRANKLADEVSVMRTKVQLLKEKNSNMNELSSLMEKQANFQKHIEELQAKIEVAEKAEIQSTTNKE
jgi:cyclopropane fatty-acyl-phospholipid synthase-like methyltransferase